MNGRPAIKLYGVSSGNGNDGVSRIFADYYCRTNEPWRLADLAALNQFKAGTGQEWALRNMESDGEAEHGITVEFLNPPCEDTADGEYPELESDEDSEAAEDGRNWSDNNGAWLILEVYPVEESDARPGVTIAESLADCFSPELLAMVPSEESAR